ncbi:MAG: hypothetical protein GEU99_19140 [Luteitalea sp.]|nr:hypothetical protein [Luteitalea sp.]
MKRESNKLKHTISEGRIALGTCICSFSPAIVEVAGLSGLVWCRIDNEHAWRQDESVEHVLRAAALSGIVPLLRVDKGEPHLVRKALEAGAGGVIVPHIQNARDAEEIVQAAKFPPRGTRGFSSLCFSGSWGVGGADDGLGWMEWSNDETLVIPMVEEPEAVGNVDEILAVEGVDGVFFGASDYSVLAGVPLQASHPKVMDAISRTVDAARHQSKFVMLGAKYPWWDDVRRLVAMGIQAVEIGHDISVLSTMWKKTIEELR